jgi:hypothetical protein
MRDKWNCYRASEEAGGDRRQHLFSMRKCSLVQSSGDETQVHMCSTASSSTDGNSQQQQQQVPSFRVQGSFWRRSCKIRKGDDGEEVARITRKKAGAASLLESVTLGDGVFSLLPSCRTLILRWSWLSSLSWTGSARSHTRLWCVLHSWCLLFMLPKPYLNPWNEDTASKAAMQVN